jgi:hypothetical protein
MGRLSIRRKKQRRADELMTRENQLPRAVKAQLQRRREAPFAAIFG